MIRSYSSLLTWLGLTIIASIALYHTSDRVNQLDQQLRQLNNQIESERGSMHILQAEWVYLSNPARVEAITRRHLDLLPTATQRVVALRDIGSLLPVKNGAEPVPAVETASNDPKPTPLPEVKPAPSSSHIIAALTGKHINEHMIMQYHAVAAQSGSKVQASTDGIGGLIGTLGLHP